MTHKIKILEQYASAVVSGDKCFEVRKNDRNYQVGDFVEFIVIDAAGEKILHELNGISYVITYVLSGLSGFGIKDGWVVFGMKRNRFGEGVIPW